MDNSELMDIIKYTEYSKKVSELYNELLKINEPNMYEAARKKLDEELVTLSDNYIEYLLTIINNYPIEMVFAITYMLYNQDYDVFIKLLEKNNEKVMRAFAMIKTIGGDSCLEIKNNLDKVKNNLNKNISLRGLDARRKENVFNREAKEYELLNKYLCNLDDKNVEEMTHNDLQFLLENLRNVDKYLFSIRNRNQVYNKSLIIYYLFLKSGLDLNIIDKIYNEVLLKNESLISFDYNPIIMFDSKFIRNVRGLFKKCNKDFFSSFSNQFITSEKCEDINKMLQDIIKINSDDEIGLGWFFIQVDMHASEKLKNYLKKFDYYKKYSGMDIKNMYDDTIDKLLKKDVNNIDSSIIESIGLYNGFINKYDTFLEMFYNSEDIKYQELLLLPLTTGLIEKKKREYGLDFKIVFTNKDIDNGTFGSYDSYNNILFINPHILRKFDNKKEAFVNSVQTIFHEIRHACQFKDIERKLSLKNESVLSSIDAIAHFTLPIHRENKRVDVHISFDNLLMAMDSAMNLMNPRYYKHNYQNISYERDARKTAYLESIKFFSGIEDMQQYIKKEEDISFSESIIRENPDSYDSSTFRMGVIEQFVNYCNEQIRMGKIDTIVEIFTKYPILSRFFTIRIRSKGVVPRDEKHFDKVINEIDKISDISKKKEALYAIKMFNYALRVQSYMHENYCMYKMMDDETMESKLGAKPSK